MKNFRTSAHLGLAAAVAALVGLGVLTPSVQAHPDYSCASCHVPHAANVDPAVPLWNPDHSVITSDLATQNYTSDTMDATTSAPDGASKLCLSCHDGSYGHVDDDHSFTSSARATGQLGGLQATHPISFVYDAALASTDGELKDPSTLASDVLDTNSKMQCTSCHDVHSTAVADIPDDPSTTQDESLDQPNLRWPYNPHAYGVSTAFCRNCHNK